MIRRLAVLMIATSFLAADPTFAEEPLTLKTVKEPAESKRDEPIAPKLSLERAAHFLDSAAPVAVFG